MITIKRTFPTYQKHTFASVADLTNWAIDYATRKGCDADAYVRSVEHDGEIEFIDDKAYTLGELFYDGWREEDENA